MWTDGEHRALCLGPDESVLSAAGTDRDAIAAAFAGLFADLPHSLVEISDREIAVNLQGPDAATLLTVGCPVDVESFAVGSGARTIFDGVQAVLYPDGLDRFTLEIWRSFLLHVLDLLETVLLQGCGRSPRREPLFAFLTPRGRRVSR